MKHTYANVFTIGISYYDFFCFTWSTENWAQAAILVSGIGKIYTWPILVNIVVFVTFLLSNMNIIEAIRNDVLSWCKIVYCSFIIAIVFDEFSETKVSIWPNSTSDGALDSYSKVDWIYLWDVFSFSSDMLFGVSMVLTRCTIFRTSVTFALSIAFLPNLLA